MCAIFRQSQIDSVTCGCIVFPKDFPLRQAFWTIPNRARDSNTEHVFWLESCTGQINAICVQGIGRKNPEALVPALAEFDTASDDQLLKAWLFPPQLQVKILRNVPVNPAEFSWNENDGCEAELASAAQDFFSNLDQKIINALGADATVSAYNLVRAWPQHVFRNRLQACEKYPWIRAELGFSTVRPALPALSAEVLNSINFGKKFELLLAEQYGVDRHALRCASQLSRKLFSEWNKLPVLFAVVGAMKPDFRLRVGENWNEMLPLLRWFERWQLEADPVFLRQFVKEIFSDGIAGAQRIFRRELLGHNPSDPSFDIEDYLRSLQLGHRQRDISPAAFGQIFRERVQASGSVVSVFLESVAWHRAQIEAARLANLSFTWPPLVEANRLEFRHFRARELTSAAALAIEGVAQSNCVYSYADRCEQGDNFIFSLEHRTGQHLRTTAHYAREANGLRLVEHSAYDNSTPCAEAQANAAELLIFLLNSLQSKFTANRAPD